MVLASKTLEFFYFAAKKIGRGIPLRVTCCVQWDSTGADKAWCGPHRLIPICVTTQTDRDERTKEAGSTLRHEPFTKL
jgi:hypothetical protein